MTTTAEAEAEALALDAADPLSAYRERFLLPGWPGWPGRRTRDLSRRPVAGPPANDRACRGGGPARPLGPSRRRGALRTGRSVVHLRRGIPRADGADRRRRAVRGRDPEHPDGQPPSDAGLVLPAVRRPTAHPDRRPALPVGPARPRQPPGLPRPRPGGGPHRGRPADRRGPRPPGGPRGGHRRARADHRVGALRRRQLRDGPGPADPPPHGRGPRGRGHGRLGARARRGEPAARPPRRRRRLRGLVHLQVPQRRPGLGGVDLRPRPAHSSGQHAAAADGLVGRDARTPLRPERTVRRGHGCGRVEDVDGAALQHGAARGVARDLRRGRDGGAARPLDPADRLSRRDPRGPRRRDPDPGRTRGHAARSCRCASRTPPRCSRRSRAAA